MDLKSGKPDFGFATRSYPNKPAQLQRLARTQLLLWQVQMIICNKGITKALIRLRGCAG